MKEEREADDLLVVSRGQEVGSFCVFYKHFLPNTRHRNCCSPIKAEGEGRPQPNQVMVILTLAKTGVRDSCLFLGACRAKTKSLFRFSLTGIKKEENFKCLSILVVIILL